VGLIGRIVLGIWIAIIAICALVMAVVFITHPSEFRKPSKSQNCVVVDDPANPGGAYSYCPGEP